MKIGVNLINFGPGVTPESLARSTELAESLGYHYRVWERTTSFLDTHADDPEATRQPEVAWRMLTTLAERILDLPRETLR